MSDQDKQRLYRALEETHRRLLRASGLFEESLRQLTIAYGPSDYRFEHFIGLRRQIINLTSEIDRQRRESENGMAFPIPDDEEYERRLRRL